MIRKIASIVVAAGMVSTTVLAMDQAQRCTAPVKVCERHIRALLAGQPYFGAKFTESRWGLVIRSVAPDSPAGRAGFVEGDRIYAVNGQDATKADIFEFKKMLSASKSKRVTLSIVRGNRVARISARLGELTKEQVDKVVENHVKEAHKPADQQARKER